MAKIKANTVKVKVVPKGLKAIPGILLNKKFIVGEPMELDLNKKEIQKCMNFADVYDLTSGEEVLIDEISFKDIKEFVEEDEVSEEDEEDEPQDETPSQEVNAEDQSETIEDPVEPASLDEEDEEELIRKMIEEEEAAKK